MVSKSQIFLPLNLRIDNKEILVIGGGKVGAQKVRLLKRFAANITVLSIQVSQELILEKVRWIKKGYEKNDLNGYFIIYACTNNRALNMQIKKDAEKLNCLVNVVDDPELCDFISPAIYKENEMTVAVSSNGQNV